MKILLFFLLFTACAIRVNSQSTLPLRADTVVIEKVGGNANFKLKDDRRDSVGGILTNIGGGVYKGKIPRRIGDSLYIGNAVIFVGGGSSVDTTNKWLNDIRRRPGTDTVEKFKNGTWQFAFVDSTEGSGSGITTLAPIGSSPNANAATISGSTLTLQPADGSFGGVVTTTAQTLPGNKTFTGRRTNFNGFAPRTNSQWLPSSRQPDSIYIANRYLGFGFIDMFASGTYVMVYTSAANHICQEGVVMLAKSKDQGRTWVSDTIVTGGSGYDVTMGGGGVSPSNRLIVFFQRLDNTTQLGQDLRIMYSDDEGETFSAEQTQSTNSETGFQMYGGLVKIGGDSLLLSWYGLTGSTYSSYVIKSGDDGATWTNPITVVSSSASQYTESSFTYLGGQTIIGLIRREQNDSTFAQVISYDNGNTWAYQGRVSWGIQGTPAWLKTFTGSNGKKVVVAYYRSGTIGNFEERAIYGYADSLILGPSKWDLNTEVTLATALDGSGYLTVCHPYDQMYGIGYYYDETLAQSDATIKFLTFPKGVNLPIGASSGISGLTADRVSIAASASSLKDFSSLTYRSSDKVLAINSTTIPAFSGHNGGVVSGGKTSLILSDDNFSAILQNATLDGDYKGVGTGGASAFIQDNGSFYLFGTPSTSAGATISWATRLRIDATGAWHINGTPGVADQVLVSNGSGATPSWQTHVSSQWLDVVSPAGIKYSGGNLGVGIDALAPLHIHAATTGAGNYAARISDNNTSNGAELLIDYRGGGTNEKVKSIITDATGLNFAKRTDAFGTPVIQFSIKHNGTINIPSLDTDGTAPTTSGTTKMVVSDANGDISFKDEPTGGTTIYAGDGTLASDRTVSTGGFTTTWTGSNDSETSFSVTNSGTTAANAIAGNVTGSTGAGVTGTSTAGNGVVGTSSSNYGVVGTSTTGAAFRGQINPASDNAIENGMSLLRTTSAGAGANGLGAAIQYELETATNGTSQTAGRIAFAWSDATNASRTSRFEIYGVNNTTLARKAAVAGNGQWTWDGYGAGTHTGTPTASLQTTSAGAIIEGPVLAAGLYTPTFTAVTNTSSPLPDGARYTRIGNIVTFSFRFSVTTTSGASVSSVRVTLPVSSNFSNINQAAGTCSGSLGYVDADAANDELTVNWISGISGSETIVVTGQYTIL